MLGAFSLAFPEKRFSQQVIACNQDNGFGAFFMTKVLFEQRNIGSE